MKLIYPEALLEMTLTPQNPVVLTLESPQIYSDFVGNMWSQTNGQEGNLRLLEKDKELKIAKEICFILNPFAVNCNDRKILSKVYEELAVRTDEVLAEEKTEINAALVEFLDKLLLQEPYHLEAGLELDVQGLLKLYNVHMEYEGETLLERIIDYLRLMHQVCKIKAVVFIGLKAYLAEEELQQLYEFTLYEQIDILLIESTVRPALGNETGIIVDRELCVIYQ